MITGAWWVVGLIASGPVFEAGPALPGDGVAPNEVEVAKIRRHLRMVEATLRATTPPGLSPDAREARTRALDALHDYWIAGVFPINRDFPDRRVPYFIDAEGTACAVGHLMVASGDGDLAREIATYENNDFVADIGHPGVGPWLELNGLTAVEAAWIQPTYGPCGGAFDPVCGSDGKSYQCEAIAMNCAGVDVEAMGMCEGDEEADVIEDYEVCNGDDTGSADGDEAADEGSDDGKGCRVGDPAPLPALVVLLGLVLCRRRVAV